MANSKLVVSDAGLALIKKYEGLSLKPYLCPAGVPTIGYGHTGKDVTLDCVPLPDENAAEALLREDVKICEIAVVQLVKVPLTQWQFDALMSFVFNLGAPKFRRSSLLRFLNEGQYWHAADEFPKWVKATDPKNGKKVTQPGLVKRRKAERGMFLGCLTTFEF